MYAKKNKPHQKNTRVSKRSACERDSRQLSLFSGDVEQPTHEQTAAFVVGGTEYRLKPAPTNPRAALLRVMRVVVQLRQERDSWLSQLQKLERPISLSLKSDTECFVRLWNTDQNDFVGVRNLNGTLHFHFPHSNRWVDIGLDWLVTERCRCGHIECPPAPFRPLPCSKANR